MSSNTSRLAIGRRSLLKAAGATAATAAVGFTPTRFAIGQQAKIKIGLMLPYSGTFALLGQNITDALKLAINEKGGKLGGREITFVQVDDESAPPKADQNANRLVVGEKVDVLVGTVHSGVAMAMVKVAREEDDTLMICPTPAPTRSRAPLARRTSSARRSATGSRPTRWAR